AAGKSGVKPPRAKAASSRRGQKRRQAAAGKSGVKPPRAKAASSRRTPKGFDHVKTSTSHFRGV
ncbi:MAG TPA: hypothetical protein VMS31_21855, partial [Pyrinomonadaceae bacterium]|nr:hypothetical protein [Pyrinomonadaceae bacterium]